MIGPEKIGACALKKNLVSIVIVTWNSAATLEECFRSIHEQTYTEIELIVVDNGSCDDTLRIVDAGQAKIIANNSNLGFSKANNQGIRIAQGEYILFLNADASLDPDFVSILARTLAEDPSLGSACGKIYRNRNGSKRIIDSAGLLMQDWRFLPLDRGSGKEDSGQFDGSAYVFGVPGAACLYRRTALDNVRLCEEYFDEDFFAFYEDVDLAWRVRNAGWRSVCVTKALAFHNQKGPTERPLFIQVKCFSNRYWCYLKNERFLCFLTYGAIAVPYEIFRVLKKFVLKPSFIPYYFREWGILPRMLNKRSAIKHMAN